MGHLKMFLLLTFASFNYLTHSSHTFQNSSFTLQEEDENFNLKFTNFSSHDLLDEKESHSPNVHWFRRQTVSTKESESKTNSRTDEKTFKSTEFEAETFFPSNDTREDGEDGMQSETFQNQDESGEQIFDDEEAHPEKSEEVTDELVVSEPESGPNSFTSVVTKSVSKILGPSEPKIEKRQFGDKMAMKQMKMQMIMNKMQMKMQTITNMMAMKMMMKMKMKKMKYDMMKKKMKMKMEMAKVKEKKKICKACKKCGGYGKAEPELVKIDRIKLKKVPMPVDAHSYKKIARGGKGGFRLAGKGGYSFPEPLVNPEPEVLALPEPEIFTKKQLVSYDYTQYPNYGDDYYGGDYMNPNMTMMMMMMNMMTTTTTTPAPTMMPASLIAPAAFVTFPPVNVNTGRKK